MNEIEKEIIRNFAFGDKTLREQSIAIFRKYLTDKEIDSLEMKFMSEVDSVCPDLSLKYKYRQELVRLIKEK